MAPPRKKVPRPPIRPVEIFIRAQEVPLYQQDKYRKEMMKILLESENENEFYDEFKIPLLPLLASASTLSYTKRMISFIVGFLMDKLVKENDDGQETLGSFLRQTFDYLFQIGKYDDKHMRFNVCSILNQLLCKIAEQEMDMDEELCEKIITFVISERICDKVAPIREEAVKVLQWLQDDSNTKCNVTRTLMFHMDRDQSSDVRRTILKVIRVSPMTLPAIVRRTRDIKDTIRIDAYKVLAERRKMTSLSYNARETVIISGLKDESAEVRKAMETYLLPHWLKQLEGGLLQFVQELDAETHPHVPRLVLEHLFKTTPVKDLLQPLQPVEGEKFVPLLSLDPPLALYWSSLAKYLRTDEERQDETGPAFETLMPSVTELCTYIEMYFNTPTPSDLNMEQLDAHEAQRIATIIYLLDLFDHCDLSDEAGRKNLSKMLEKMLLSREADQRVLSAITKKLILGYVDPCQRVNAVLGILDELHSPLQAKESEMHVMSEAQQRSHKVAMATVRIALCNLQVSQRDAIDNQDFLQAEKLKDEIIEKRGQLDEMEKALQPQPDIEMEREEVWDVPVLIKCLTILIELMKSTDVFKGSIGLADIIENFVLKCITMDHPQLMAMGVEVVGMYCLQRLTNAKNHFPMFYALLNHDMRQYDEVRAMCVTCICAIITHHGIKPLGIPEDEPVFATEQRVKLNTTVRPDLSFISSISYLMDDPVMCVRNASIIGLCKMMLSGRISSNHLLSKLLLLWFNPATNANKILMKMLGDFLTYYPTYHYEAPKHLVQALLPTLDIVLDAPVSSPLLDIDPKEVGLFIIDMVRPGKNKFCKENLHDKIAATLMEKVWEEPTGDAASLFLRLCINLQISLDDDDVRQDLLHQAKRIKRDCFVDSKNKDIDKLIFRLKGNDSGSSQASTCLTQDSQMLSQTSQEESEPTSLLHPALRVEENGMDVDSFDEGEESMTQNVRCRRRRPLRRSRPAGHVSESDSDSDSE